MELRFHVTNGAIERIREATSIRNGSDIGQEAVFLFDWAVEQAKEGRKIYAAHPTGGAAETFDAPILRGVRFNQDL